MQSGFRAFLVSCASQDIKILSACFLMPVGLVSRVNNLTTLIGKLYLPLQKLWRKISDQKGKNLLNLGGQLPGVFTITKAGLKQLNLTKFFF